MESSDSPTLRRGIAARLGIVLLNMFAPGLGLIRVGRTGEGAGFLFWFPAAILVFTGIAYAAPAVSPGGYLALMASAIVAYLLIFLATTVRVWRFSRFADIALRWWQKWYALVGLYALSFAAMMAATAFARTVYKPYYLPAASMEPGLAVDDQLVADMRVRHVMRGDVVIVKVSRFDYVKRVAAIGGDRIKLLKGVVFINGVPVAQRAVGAYHSDGRDGVRLSENFPGEVKSHEILDFGPNQLDDIDEQIIPPDHYYLLGDSRDNSADSRVDRDLGGIGGAVPATDLRGLVLFKSFDSRMRWVGQVVR